MSARGFGTQTLTGAAQPMFGTTTTAATVPNPDLFTGGLNPASNPSQTIIPVSQNIFRKGDRVLIGTASNFTASNTLAIDGGPVTAVNLSASNIAVGGLTRNHASGEFVVLALPCAQVSIQNGAGLLNIGEYSDVSAISPTLIGQAQPAGIFTLGWPSALNILETTHLWVQGTAADTYLPYLLTV
jgi:hypothetical protein